MTKRGWKDLKPLVLLAMEWETNVASGQSNLYSLLDEMKEKIETTYKAHDVPPEEQQDEVPVALQDEAKQMAEDNAECSSIKSSEEAEHKVEEQPDTGVMSKLKSNVRHKNDKESKMGLAGMELKH
jgi:hypothetical protein